MKEIVVGLGWDPAHRGDDGSLVPVDLDIACALLDAEGNIVELVHPGCAHNSNHSVIHTGDSRTGAGAWDDESIFVFPGAVPQTISALTFIVASVAGRRFSEIPRATCHVSDRLTEREWMRVALSDLGSQSMHFVATLSRGGAGWSIRPGAQDESTSARITAHLLPLLAKAKS